MDDLIIYIFTGLELLLSLGYTIYLQVKYPNSTLIKRKVLLSYLFVVCASIIGLFYVARGRAQSGTVLDVIFSVLLYLIAFLLVSSFLYLGSLKVGFEGQHIVKSSFFGKTSINVHSIESATRNKWAYIYKSPEKKIVMEWVLYRNYQMIVANIDLK